MAATTTCLELAEGDREELGGIARTGTEMARRVDRARMLPAKAGGESAAPMAARLGVDPNTAELCVRRYRDGGLGAAPADAPRRGRPRGIGGGDRAWVVDVARARPADLGYAAETRPGEALARHVRGHAGEAGHPALPGRRGPRSIAYSTPPGRARTAPPTAVSGATPTSGGGRARCSSPAGSSRSASTAGPVLVPRRRRHRRPLRVGRQLRVGARVFSCYLEGRLAGARPRLHPPGLRLRLARHVPRHPGTVGQVVGPPARGLSLPLGFPATVARHLPAPEVGCRSRHAVSLGHPRGGPVPRLELGDDPHLPLGGSRLPPGPRASVPSPSRRELVGPLAGPLAALGVAKGPRRPCQALAVPGVVPGGSPPRLGGVPRVRGKPACGHLAGPLAPVPPRRSADLVGYPSSAMVSA